MKLWKLHGGWALVTVLLAGAWGRWCASQRETEFRTRERELESRIVEVHRPSTPLPPSPIPTPALPPTPTPLPASPPSNLPAYDFELLAVDQIRKLIHSDLKEDWYRATTAIHRLADIPLKSSLLIEMLSCKDENIRMSVLNFLKTQTGTESLPYVQKALGTDPSSQVRMRAAILLGDLGGDGTIELLLKAMNDEDFQVRLYSAGALSRLGQPGPAADLLPQFNAELDSPDGAIRRNAVYRLAVLHSPLTLPSMTRALRDTSSDVRTIAVWGLSDLNLPEVIPLLEGLLKDPNSEVAEAAKLGLEQLKQRKGN